MLLWTWAFSCSWALLCSGISCWAVLPPRALSPGTSPSSSYWKSNFLGFQMKDIWAGRDLRGDQIQPLHFAPRDIKLLPLPFMFHLDQQCSTERSIFMLSNVVVMWLLSPQNMASATEGLNFFILFTSKPLNLNSHLWLASILLDSTDLELWDLESGNQQDQMVFSCLPLHGTQFPWALAGCFHPLSSSSYFKFSTTFSFCYLTLRNFPELH